VFLTERDRTNSFKGRTKSQGIAKVRKGVKCGVLPLASNICIPSPAPDYLVPNIYGLFHKIYIKFVKPSSNINKILFLTRAHLVQKYFQNLNFLFLISWRTNKEIKHNLSNI
jgi:hypothetical protein